MEGRYNGMSEGIQIGRFKEGGAVVRDIENALKAISKCVTDGSPDNGYSFYRGRIYSVPTNEDIVMVDLLGADDEGYFKKIILEYNSVTKTLDYVGKVVHFIPKYEKVICESIHRFVEILMKIYESHSGLLVSQLYFDFLSNGLGERVSALYVIDDVDSPGEKILFASAGDSYVQKYDLADSREVTMGTCLWSRWGVIISSLKAMNLARSKAVDYLTKYRHSYLPMKSIYMRATDEDLREKLIPYIGATVQECLNAEDEDVRRFYINNARVNETYLMSVAEPEVSKYIENRERLKKMGILYPDGLGVTICDW